MSSPNLILLMVITVGMGVLSPLAVFIISRRREDRTSWVPVVLVLLLLASVPVVALVSYYSFTR